MTATPKRRRDILLYVASFFFLAIVVTAALSIWNPSLAAAGGLALSALGGIIALLQLISSPPPTSDKPEEPAGPQKPTEAIGAKQPDGAVQPRAQVKREWAELQVTNSRAFGRQRELAQLAASWSDPGTNVVALCAWTGVGKTALLNEWLRRVDSDPPEGLERIFCWSFNNRTPEEAAVACNQFLRHALLWMGDPAPDAGSAWVRGERLARLVREKPTLLVLDGIESLLAGDSGEADSIVEPAMSILLTDLAQDNNGLCVVSTRRLPSELRREAEHVRTHNLNDISPEAGRDLLRSRGVKGTDARLEQIAQDFGPNALAVQLLASYLADADPAAADALLRSAAGDHDAVEGSHARLVLAAWREQLGPASAEVQLLSLMSIFDRPARRTELQALIDERIPEVSDRLPDTSTAQWHGLVAGLRGYGLLAAGRHGDSLIDLHPLIRTFFGDGLAQRPEAAKQAHGVMQKYLTSTIESPADTTSKRLHVYRAMRHAVAAREFGEAMRLHWDHIREQQRHLKVRDYSQIAVDFAFWSSFFAEPWTVLYPELSTFGKHRPYIFSETAWDLFSLGRAQQAVAPAETALQESVGMSRWVEAAGIATNLANIHLSYGDIRGAHESAGTAIAYSDREPGESEGNRTVDQAYRRGQARVARGLTLLYQGQLAEAKAMLLQAEAIHQERGGAWRLLREHGAYALIDILLRTGAVGEAVDRAERTVALSPRTRDNDVPQIGPEVEKVALGRAYARRGDHPDSLLELMAAVDALRQIGRPDVVVPALLALAEAHRLAGNPQEAAHDRAMAHSLAAAASLYPALVDAEVERARQLAPVDPSAARAALEAAREEAERLDYGQALLDIAAARAELGR